MDPASSEWRDPAGPHPAKGRMKAGLPVALRAPWRRIRPELPEIAHGALRGVIAAMAMTGMRALTTNLGLVEEEPPRAILRQRLKGLHRLAPNRNRRAAQELFHCTYGGAGGAAFAALPESIRMRAWAGPAYGLMVWLGFELGLAPLLNLSQSHRPRPVDRVALAADHLLYGFVLSETRRRPQG